MRLDPGQRIGVGALHRRTHSRIAAVHVVATDQVEDASHSELLIDLLVRGHEHELAADIAQIDRISRQHVHEGGPEVTATAQADDHDRTTRGGGRARQRGLERRRGGEEQTAVGLKDDDLVGG